MDLPAVSNSGWLLLTAAAFAAGVLNAVAGGGSFLTLPALVAVGVPPIPANATSALAVSPGYLGSTLGFRAILQPLPRSLLLREGWISAVGGLIGAGLLLVTPARVFAAVVPWLLVFATLLFAAGPRIAAWARRPANRESPHRPAAAQAHLLARWRQPALLLVCIYGGYFNGGLGILLMALYAVTGEDRVLVANALKNLNSLVLSWLSVAAFVAAGAVAWAPGLVMMAAATAGGYAGAHWAQRLPAAWVRAGVIATGAVMSAVFFQRAG